MIKRKFNERWCDRDRAYEKLPIAVQEGLYFYIQRTAERLHPKHKKRDPGRPRKISDVDAAFLAAVREYHHQMPFRGKRGWIRA